MTPAAIALVVVLLVGVLAGAAFAIYAAFSSSHWLTLPNANQNRYVAPPDVNPNTIVRALRLAGVSLRMRTNFPAQAIADVLAKVNVMVLSTDAWVDGFGRKIGGFVPGDRSTTIVVGHDLSAVFHELAHLLEWNVYGAPDSDHVRWVERGIAAGDEDFRASLGSPVL